jgi:hypothetical protein
MKPKYLIENVLVDPHSPVVPVVPKLVVDLGSFDHQRGQRRTDLLISKCITPKYSNVVDLDSRKSRDDS